MKQFKKHWDNRLMKSSVVFLFMILSLVFPSPVLSVQAETDSDVYVSDCLDGGQDCAQEEGEGAEVNDETPAADRKTDGAAVRLTPWDYIKTVLALAFVIGLLYALLKFINRKNRMYDKNRLMKNMGGIPLGQHKSIQLVVIGDSYYLIGVGDEIRLLKEITDPDEIDKLLEYYEDDGLDTPANIISTLLKKVSNKKETTGNDNPYNSPDFSKQFNARLDEMKEERKRHIGRLTEKERNRDE